MNNEKKNNAKNSKYALLQKKIKGLQDENRRLKKDRDKYKQQRNDMRKELKHHEEDLHTMSKLQKVLSSSREKVPRHKYPKLATNMATKIRSNTSCGAADVAKILEIFNEETGGILGDDVPCANTIDNWVTKCGLYEYENAANRFSGKPYAMIIDDSMIVGGQRLLIILLIPAEHGGSPLTHGDVVVGGIYVRKSFNAEFIKKALTETAEKVGKRPEYVISDNASIMLKGTRRAEMPHHCDITHTLGMFLERTYKKQTDFSEFSKQVSDVFFKCNMLPVAYLLPPKQRSVARFINMDRWVNWAHVMLNTMPFLTRKEREVFLFLPHNASLIDELHEVISCVRHIETVCKREGLSKETEKKCLERVNNVLISGSERMRTVGLSIKKFLKKETGWMGNEKHNNSSDIIESTYGTYKAKKAANKMYGVTSLVLRLSLCGKTLCQDFRAEQGLVNTKMRDIQEWKKKNLLPNFATKRLRLFRLAS